MTKKQEVLRKAEAILAQKPFSKQAEAEFHSLMLLHDALADEPEERGNGNNNLKADELRARLNVDAADAEFRQFTRDRSLEKRTYAALSEGAAPGSLNIPSQWRREYNSKLVSASGWLQAGITVKDTRTGRNYISFFDDDSANVAVITTDNSPLPQANPTFQSPTATVFNFASSTTLSNTLNQDVQNGSFDVDAFLQTLLGKRVGRAFNTFTTNDATYGLLPQITVSATAASTSVPTLAELVAMQGAVNQAYLEPDSKPVYMLSQALKIRLQQQVTSTGGAKLYPELENGKLLGLPAIVNADMTANAGDTAVVCGSIARLAIVEDVQPALIKSVERYAEFFQTLYGICHRLGVKLIDQNAAVSLKLHA